jgi:hypothetical protein
MISGTADPSYTISSMMGAPGTPLKISRIEGGSTIQHAEI